MIEIFLVILGVVNTGLVLYFTSRNQKNIVSISERVADTLREVVSDTKDKDFRIIELLSDGLLYRNLEEFSSVRQQRQIIETDLKEANIPFPASYMPPLPKTPEEERKDFEKEFLK